MKQTRLILSLIFIAATHLHSQDGWRQLTEADGLGLESNVINQIFQAQNGDIWIGQTRGIQRFNGLFEESSDYASFDHISELPSGQILARRTLVDNGIREIVLFNGVEWAEPDFLAENNIKPLSTIQLSVLSDDKIWFATTKGLLSFNGQEWKSYDDFDFRPRWLVKTDDGRFWSVNWQMEIMSFDGQKWTSEFDLNDSGNWQSGTLIRTALATFNGQILLGTNNGLFQYDPRSNLLIDLQIGFVEVRCLYQTNDRQIWVGTDSGLYHLLDGKWQLSLSEQIINLIHQDQNDSLWCGTSQGLYRFDSEERILETDGTVNCLNQLADGNLLVGGNTGLRLTNLFETSQIWQLQPKVGKLILNIFKASDGTLWCVSDTGISKYDGVNWMKQVDWSRSTIEDWKGLIYEAKDGTMWFDSYSYQNEIAKRHKIGGSYYFVGEANNDEIWAGGGSGLVHYDGSDWVRVEYGDWPFKIFEAQDGTVWLNGKHGLRSFDGQKWTNHLEIGNGETFFQSDDGTLWAGHGDVWNQSTPLSGIYRLGPNGEWVKSVQTGYVRMIEKTSLGALVAIDERGGLLTYDGNKWDKHLSYGDGTQLTVH